MRSAESELQNTIELRATASEIAAPKPDLGAKAKKTQFWSFFHKEFWNENTSSKIDKICWQIIIAALMQPFQYDLWCPAAKDIKDINITHAAAAPGNFDATVTMRLATSRG